MTNQGNQITVRPEKRILTIIIIALAAIFIIGEIMEIFDLLKETKAEKKLIAPF